MSLKINYTPEGEIKSIQTAPSVFSYSFLVAPRLNEDGSPGKYGTELIIRDEETIKALKVYLKQELEKAKIGLWGGTIPQNVTLPLRVGNEEKEVEAGAMVLKTSSKAQPKLFILNKNGRAVEVSTEDQLEEIYSGMIGEAIVTFRGYDYKSFQKKGITCYINAACKTDEGTPFAGDRYEDSFSISNEFDIVPETPTTPTTVEAVIGDILSGAVLNEKKVLSVPEAPKVEPSVDDLISGVKDNLGITKGKGVSIEDLLK